MRGRGKSYPSLEDFDLALDWFPREGILAKSRGLNECQRSSKIDTPVVLKSGKAQDVETKRRFILDAKKNRITDCGRTTLSCPKYSTWSWTSSRRSGHSGCRLASTILCFTEVGQTQARDRTMAIILPVWRCLILAFKKGQIGQSISWMGSRLILTRSCALATLQSDTITELKSLLRKISVGVVVSATVVQPVAGELSIAARPLTAWQPFLRDFSGSHKQVTQAIHWFLAFLGRRTLRSCVRSSSAPSRSPPNKRPS